LQGRRWAARCAISTNFWRWWGRPVEAPKTCGARFSAKKFRKNWNNRIS
jgi:hypothetical protein